VLYQVTLAILRSRIIAIVAEVFGRFEFLKQRVTSIFSEHLQACATNTRSRLQMMQAMEQQPFTRNDHYFVDYRDKFLTHYKALRRNDTQNFFCLLKPKDENGLKGETGELLDATMAGIRKLGFPEVQLGELSRLLPPDPMEAAIGIMADVRAYFQVAYKRFVDIVPMTIDYTLVSGVTEGLENALYTGLGASGSESYERCQRLLEEPEDISRRREELVKRRDRLVRARDEMFGVVVS